MADDGKQLILETIGLNALGNVARDRLKTGNYAAVRPQLHVLSDPHLFVLRCEHREFVVRGRRFFQCLSQVELLRLAPFVLADQTREADADEVLDRRADDLCRDWIHVREIPIAVRLVDDVARKLDQVTVAFIILAQVLQPARGRGRQNP